MMFEIDFKALRKRVLYILSLTLFILYGLFLVSNGRAAGYLSIFGGLFLIAINLIRLAHNYVEITLSPSKVRIRKPLLFRIVEIEFDCIDEIKEIESTQVWKFDFARIEILAEKKRYMFGKDFLTESSLEKLLDFWNN